jgi:hypothetical protein
MMNLRDEWADRIDHGPAVLSGLLYHLGGCAVCAQHHRESSRDLRDVLDENDADTAEGLNDELVVDDLVVAIDRRWEDPHHPGKGVDRLLDTGAKASGGSQDDLFNRHAIKSRRLPKLRYCP